MNLAKTALSSALVLALAGCGGSDDDNTAKTGQFSLGVSDSPALATNVTIAFDRVVLKGSSESYTFDVTEEGELKQVNLLDYQGQEVETLVSGQEVPVGEYQMCIYMKNDTTGADDTSFVIAEEAMKGLISNSQGSCGNADSEDQAVKEEGRIFLNKKFPIAVGDNRFVAEFNLAKLQPPKGNKDYWVLKPTDVVRIENVSDVGTISGSVDSRITADCLVEAGDDADNRSAVYLYRAGATLDGSENAAKMADFRDAPYTTLETAPIASARVDEEGKFEFGFVVASDYALGYTCVAQKDDPVADDMNGEEASFFLFDAIDNVVVEENSTTEVAFGSN
ncbi:DUF4382 domain-containing protein [Ferrimonas marina]|uniref:DUF4382 domain-containing protein n=1 Tax=Ferrimonas marina TaxID=299255 RepID=A0A1M5XE94_9GAMM|nr:DUF4382 domain-containing protein [Ferrimonas marina]SHH98205.1 protein of unknown function [Ferrimonas marina]